MAKRAEKIATISTSEQKNVTADDIWRPVLDKKKMNVSIIFHHLMLIIEMLLVVM